MVEPGLALTITTEPPLRNRLLGALPHAVFCYLRPHLKPGSLTRGKVLCEADEPLRRVYFVESGAVSLVTVFSGGMRRYLLSGFVVRRPGSCGPGRLPLSSPPGADRPSILAGGPEDTIGGRPGRGADGPRRPGERELGRRRARHHGPWWHGLSTLSSRVDMAARRQGHRQGLVIDGPARDGSCTSAVGRVPSTCG